MASGTNADAMVIGAGLIGCSVAWRLAMQGLSVALIDAGFLGGEASSASAGMLAPGGEVERRSEWADTLVESARIYPGFVKEVAEESGVEPDFRACGAFEVALSDGEWASLAKRAEVQRSIGIASSAVRASDLPPGLSPAAKGALFYPGDAVVDPRTLLQALSKACVGRRVRVFEQTRIGSIDLGNRGVSAVAEAKRFEARVAVLAAGAWSSQVTTRYQQALSPVPGSIPVKGHLVGYDLAPGTLGPIVRHQHTYVLQRATGLTVGGSTEERVGFDRRVQPALVSEVHRRVRELLPSLVPPQPSSSWIGFRPATQLMQPEVRRWQSSPLWLAYGHYRNGILAAPVTAERIAAEIAAMLAKEG